MKRLLEILCLPVGCAIYLAMLAYLAWERRTSRWHKQPRPLVRRSAPARYEQRSWILAQLRGGG